MKTIKTFAVLAAAWLGSAAAWAASARRSTFPVVASGSAWCRPG